MLLLNNQEVFLSEGLYHIFVKGTAEIYFKTKDLTDFVKDVTLVDEAGVFTINNGISIKAIFTEAEVSIIS